MTKSIMVGGMMRSFLVHVPSGYTGKSPVPVVIDFHPLGGSGPQWKSATNWASVADSHGFIVVWPSGVGSSWNVGRCCGSAQSQNVDDVAFTKAIVTTLASEACIDRKRVYATGCSNGGGMAYKLACDAADVIAAVAPVDFDCITGPTSNPSCASCTPARPISETQFRGTSDVAVPYNGGSTPVVAGLMFPGAPSNFSTWGGINACTGTPAPLPAHADCKTYPMCGGGVDTTLCTVQNGTHCGNYQSFGIVDIVWEQFQRESLP
jgi:polyhydroxybutyrate depolymerase